MMGSNVDVRRTPIRLTWGLLHAICAAAILTLMASVLPAEAALEFDIVISGPGLREPVTIQWAQIARTEFFVVETEANRPPATLPPAYDMEVRDRLPNGEPLEVHHWTYYPRVGVILTDDSRSPWLRPTNSLKSLLDDKIAKARSGADKDLLWPISGAAIAIGVGFLASLALRMKRKRRAFA